MHGGRKNTAKIKKTYAIGKRLTISEFLDTLDFEWVLDSLFFNEAWWNRPISPNPSTLTGSPGCPSLLLRVSLSSMTNFSTFKYSNRPGSLHCPRCQAVLTLLHTPREYKRRRLHMSLISLFTEYLTPCQPNQTNTGNYSILQNRGIQRFKLSTVIRVVENPA